MAVIKVKQVEKASPLEKSKGINSIFYVELCEGSLEPGIKFVGYETYHRCDIRVLELAPVDGRWKLFCDFKLWYDEQFSDAVFDSSGSKRGKHFFYHLDNK